MQDLVVAFRLYLPELTELFPYVSMDCSSVCCAGKENLTVQFVSKHVLPFAVYTGWVTGNGRF